MMAACYLFHVVKNHPFVDGNKRVGLEASLVFLELNGYSIETEDELLVTLVLQTATGTIDKAQIANFFQQYSIAST